MENVHIRIKLQEEGTNNIKWYVYETRCRLAEAMPRTIDLESKLMALQHLKM